MFQHKLVVDRRQLAGFLATIGYMAPHVQKSLETSIRIEGYRLMRLLKKEVRASSPGGSRMRPMRIIGRFHKTMRRKDDPLAKAAPSARYVVERTPEFKFRIGWASRKTSESWRKIVRKHQEGFSIPVTPELRGYMRKRLGKKSHVPPSLQRFFKIRKSTTMFRIPPRPIIGPFWSAYEAPAWANIRTNFIRKLRGERI